MFEMEEDIVALIMAGGRGTRLGGVEKALLKIGGSTFLERIELALKESACVKEIYVAVTRNTPKTESFARSLGLSIVTTSGKGYIEDSREAILKLKLGVTLILCSDIPLLNSRMIRRIVSEYRTLGKPALTVCARDPVWPENELERRNYGRFENGSWIFPAGINMLDGNRVLDDDSIIDVDVFVVDAQETGGLVNVNTPEELEYARRRSCENPAHIESR